MRDGQHKARQQNLLPTARISCASRDIDEVAGRHPSSLDSYEDCDLPVAF